MSEKVALYARVSTGDKEQTPETQLYALRKYCERVEWEIVEEYVDIAQAKDYRKRKAWQKLQKDARQYKFRVVVVFKLDRAFRSVRECENCLSDWQDRNIAFKCITQDVIDTTTAMGKFVLQVMAAAAELESSLISDRVKAGMERARNEGKHLGRPSKGITLDNIVNALKEGGNISAAARSLKISRASIHRICRINGLEAQEILETPLNGNGVQKGR